MSPAVGGVVAGAALTGMALWILRPLRRPLKPAATPDDAHWRELLESKHQLYRSILDLEFDQSVGKVSDADYHYLRRQQEGEALAILKEMDALAAAREAVPASGPPGDHPASVEDRLEREIAAARVRLHPQRAE